MPKLTFRSSLSLWFSVILALSLFVSGLIFAISYFWVSLINLENFMIREAGEVLEKHIVVKNEIMFKKDSENKSLSAYLRDENLSALVVDKSQNIIGAYGVYGGLITSSSKESFLNSKDINKVFIDGKRFFSFYNLYEGRTYLVLFYPIINDGEVAGSLVVSSDMELGRKMLVFSVGILSLILPISFLFGWVITHTIVGKLFKPLDLILSEMRNFEFGKKVEKNSISGNPNDELVKLSRHFDEMMDRVNEGIKKQREFISNTSHELKTPLTQSALELEIAEMDLIAKNNKKALRTIIEVRENLKKYGETINGLLELARIEAGKTEADIVNVYEFSKKIVEKYNNGREIVIDIDKKMKIRFPENHFKVILTNLVSNSIKYGEENKPIVLAFKVGAVGNLIVENYTSKVNKADFKQIWQRFSRLTNSESVSGYGIGLSVVKEVADFHGLNVSSKIVGTNLVRISISGFEVV